jgi:signal recognition particle subunit SRP54
MTGMKGLGALLGKGGMGSDLPDLGGGALPGLGGGGQMPANLQDLLKKH